jgi:hypothetical protein
MTIFYSIKITFNILHNLSNSQSGYRFYHQFNGRVSLPLHELYKLHAKHKLDCIPSVWSFRTIWTSPMSANCYFPNKSYVNLEINNRLTRVQIFLMASKIFNFVANIILRAQFLIQASGLAESPINNRNWPLLPAQHRRPLTHQTPNELLRGRVGRGVWGLPTPTKLVPVHAAAYKERPVKTRHAGILNEAVTFKNF